MFLKEKKIGFIGFGNIGQSMALALLKSKSLNGDQIWVVGRSPEKLLKFQEQYQYSVNIASNNEEVVNQCDVVFLSVKPQNLFECLEQIVSSFHENHLVISVAAGISLKQLKSMLPQVKSLVRVMPNSPVSIQSAVIGYHQSEELELHEHLLMELLTPMGYLVPVSDGDLFETLTVSCSSGVGFVYELMDYWQDWIEEHGFDPEVARRMTIETFLGAALLAKESEGLNFLDLQNKVASKKGVTQSGLESMRELEIERALRYSFEKAILRNRELSKF